MTTGRLLFGASLLLTTITTVSAQTVRFEVLDQSSSANDMTPDGKYVVGALLGGGGYRWSREDGYVPLGGIQAVAVSDDGSVVLGTIMDPTTGDYEAAIWRADEETWEQIPPAEEGTGCPNFTSPFELSADGTVAVGLGWESCSGRGFLWREGVGTIQLEPLANGNNRASVVSGDGTLVGGFAQGSSSRTPAVWAADGSGHVLDPPNGDVGGEVYGISDDGTIVLGEWDYKPFVWREGEEIEIFNGAIPAWAGAATDIADDGTIVGFDRISLNRKAWIRPNGGPTVDLRTYLDGLGATGLPSSLEVCQAVSTSGNITIGHNAFFHGWLVNTCVPDVTGNGNIGFDDLLAVLSTWGPCGGCPADVDLDGLVGFSDLLEVLANWGDCP